MRFIAVNGKYLCHYVLYIGRGRGGEGGYYGSRPWSQDDEAGGGYSRRRQLSQSEEDIALVFCVEIM